MSTMGKGHYSTNKISYLIQINKERKKDRKGKKKRENESNK